VFVREQLAALTRPREKAISAVLFAVFNPPVATAVLTKALRVKKEANVADFCLSVHAETKLWGRCSGPGGEIVTAVFRTR
jgi:hypothetical protein